MRLIAHTMVALGKYHQFFRVADTFVYFAGMGEGNGFICIAVNNDDVLNARQSIGDVKGILFEWVIRV